MISTLLLLFVAGGVMKYMLFRSTLGRIIVMTFKLLSACLMYNYKILEKAYKYVSTKNSAMGNKKRTTRKPAKTKPDNSVIYLRNYKKA
jgi:hypothetical protein